MVNGLYTAKSEVGDGASFLVASRFSVSGNNFWRDFFNGAAPGIGTVSRSARLIKISELAQICKQIEPLSY
jgi:hypothetical protein